METRKWARAYLTGLLAPVERKNGWQPAEAAGVAEPTGIRTFLQGRVVSALGARASGATEAPHGEHRQRSPVGREVDQDNPAPQELRCPPHSPLPAVLTTIHHTITVAAGVFAPGQLGALTSVIDFELVDAVLEQTRSIQQRLRALLSRVGVYFLLAMCLFPEVGYTLVWNKMTTALDGVPVVSPTDKALRDLRRRVSIVPMQALLDVLSGPLARPTIPGAGFGPYRTVSFDGCSSQKVPDTERNHARFGASDRNGSPCSNS